MCMMPWKQSATQHVQYVRAVPADAWLSTWLQGVQSGGSPRPTGAHVCLPVASSRTLTDPAWQSRPSTRLLLKVVVVIVARVLPAMYNAGASRGLWLLLTNWLPWMCSTLLPSTVTPVLPWSGRLHALSLMVVLIMVRLASCTWIMAAALPTNCESTIVTVELAARQRTCPMDKLSPWILAPSNVTSEPPHTDSRHVDEGLHAAGVIQSTPSACMRVSSQGSAAAVKFGPNVHDRLAVEMVPLVPSPASLKAQRVPTTLPGTKGEQHDDAERRKHPELPGRHRGKVNPRALRTLPRRNG